MKFSKTDTLLPQFADRLKSDMNATFQRCHHDGAESKIRSAAFVVLAPFLFP